MHAGTHRHLTREPADTGRADRPAQGRETAEGGHSRRGHGEDDRVVPPARPRGRVVSGAREAWTAVGRGTWTAGLIRAPVSGGGFHPSKPGCDATAALRSVGRAGGIPWPSCPGQRGPGLVGAGNLASLLVADPPRPRGPACLSWVVQGAPVSIHGCQA